MSSILYHFLSIYTHQREPLLRGKEMKRSVLAKMLETKSQFRLGVAGYVILDNHLHWLISSPAGNELSAIANHFRAAMLRDWRKAAPAREDSQLWEHGSRITPVEGVDALRHHLDFVHYDAVRHGLVTRAADYAWSSLPSRVSEGHFSDEWGTLAPPVGVARVLELAVD